MPDFGMPRLSALAFVNALTRRERRVAEMIAMGETRPWSQSRCRRRAGRSIITWPRCG